MVQTIAAEQLMLYDLEQKFQLQRVYDRQFFPEWQAIGPELTIGTSPQYAQSDVFDIERGDDLTRVLQILKQLGQVISSR